MLANPDPADWPMWRRTLDNWGFSPLDEIDTRNVDRLRLVWSRPLGDGEVIDLGGRRVRFIDTPHTPHGWDAGVLYEETTGTLLCGDLFTQLGDGPALTRTLALMHGPSFAGDGGAALSALAEECDRRVYGALGVTLWHREARASRRRSCGARA